MDTLDLHYELPDELIAQEPATPRDAARLMVVDRDTGVRQHRIFRDLVDLLAPGDLLVANDTRVVPARFWVRKPTGGRIEALFLRETGARWHVLLRGAGNLQVGTVVASENLEHTLEVVARGERGAWELATDVAWEAFLADEGIMPLPPYIKRESSGCEADRTEYQTVYAHAPGSVAAPTAGLHFTDALLDALRSRGVHWATVTLHVGLGTFAPIEVDKLTDHPMHAEWGSCSPKVVEQVRATKRAGRRVISVGTTSTRVLESVDWSRDNSWEGWTDCFIYPPFGFQAVDALITNFHLPGSTLLALVMALSGVGHARQAYADAIANNYRFYSYGDAMLIGEGFLD